jgi:hypothetical protein
VVPSSPEPAPGRPGQQDHAQLTRRLQSAREWGIAEERITARDNAGETAIVRFRDGSVWEHESTLNVDRLDRKELTSHVSAAVGAGGPEVIRTATQTWAPYVEHTAGAGEPLADSAGHLSTARGLRVSILHTITELDERDWVLGPDGLPVPHNIHHADYGTTRQEQGTDEQEETLFAPSLTVRRLRSLTQAEVNTMQRDLEALKPMFTARDRQDDWYQRTLENFARLRRRRALEVDLSYRYFTDKLEKAPVYVKSVLVRARVATAGETTRTMVDGGTVEQTSNTAEEGDFIVTNPRGEEYIVRKDNFEARYEPTQDPSLFRAKGQIRALTNPLDYDIKFTAPWGEEMAGYSDAVIAAVYDPAHPGIVSDDRYVITRDDFRLTYVPRPADAPDALVFSPTSVPTGDLPGHSNDPVPREPGQFLSTATPGEIRAITGLTQRFLSDADETGPATLPADAAAPSDLDTGLSKLPLLGDGPLSVRAADMPPEKGAIAYLKGVDFTLRDPIVARIGTRDQEGADQASTTAYGRPVTTRYVIHQLTARRIGPAILGGHGDVLAVLRRDTTLKVTDVQISADGVRTVHLTELSIRYASGLMGHPAATRVQIEDTLLRFGINGVSPGPEVPVQAIAELRDAGPVAPPAGRTGDKPAPDAGRIGGQLADILRNPVPDGAQLLARLHEAGSDPQTAQSLRAAYAERRPGHDLADDIQNASLGFDPSPHLRHLLADHAAGSEAADAGAADAGAGAGVRTPDFRAALHDAIGASDAVTASKLLDQAGLDPRELWALDALYANTYGHGISQHMDTVFGPSDEGRYLRYLAGDGLLGAPDISAREAWDLFGHMARITFTARNGVEARVPFGFADSGCYDRAHRMGMESAKWGIQARKLFVRKSEGLPVRAGSPERAGAGDPDTAGGWEYHVALTVRARLADGSTIDVVIDPALAGKPLTVDQWLAIMGVSRSEYLKFDMSGLDHLTTGAVNRDFLDGAPYRGTPLVYTTHLRQYWPDGDPGSLMEADHESVVRLDETERFAKIAQARMLRQHVLDTVLRTGGEPGRNPVPEVVRLVNSSADYALLRLGNESARPFMEYLTAPTGSPDQTARLKQIMNDANRQL